MVSYLALVEHFFFFGAQALEARFGKEKGGILLAKTRRILQDLQAKNDPQLPDPLAKRHALNALFIIALDSALKGEQYPPDQFEALVLEIYRSLLGDILSHERALFTSSPSRWDDFVAATKETNAQIYDNPHFDLAYVHENRLRFGFDLRHCLYFDLFQINGCPHLARILCKYDHIVADNLRDFIRFDRQETIGTDGSRCAYRYFNINPV